MKKSNFSLIPFSANTAPSINITGNISRHENQLNLKYLVSNLAAIVIPIPTANPTRQYDLWEHTCFEFFLRLKNTDKYWEFNLSPSGNWNVFRFLKYRHDIAEETVFDSLPFNLQQINILELDLEVNLNQIIDPKQDLEVGITAVIENQDAQLSYWALNHPASKADFHNRASFAIDL